MARPYGLGEYVGSPSFDVVPGRAVQEILGERRGEVVELVRDTYLRHSAGQTVNPDSYFLRFPDRPEARIIALPAALSGHDALAGIKWISSFPNNIRDGLPRASAVLILNDAATGYPFACLEASQISAARTAASAALAATTLRPGGFEGTSLAIVGAGVIARNIADYLAAVGARPDNIVVHDLDEPSGQSLVAHVQASWNPEVRYVPERSEALKADTVVFATTAAEPYVDTAFAPGQVVLNISLRDIAPEVILQSTNVLDDVEHCLKANTSPHLAEQLTGNRDFVDGTLADVLNARLSPPAQRAVIFSPFGLGVLDLAVGAMVHRLAREASRTVGIPDFFAETIRWDGTGRA